MRLLSPAHQWQPNDIIISHFRFPWLSEATRINIGMYTYPQLSPVSVFDVAGNPTADAVTIQLTK